MTEDGELLSVRDVARLCGRSEETVRRWIWSGKLKAQKLGGQLFVNRADVPGQAHPRLGEAMATYITARNDSGRALPLRTVDGRAYNEDAYYDKAAVLASLKRASAFSEKLAARGIKIDVVEALRESREGR